MDVGKDSFVDDRFLMLRSEVAVVAVEAVLRKLGVQESHVAKLGCLGEHAGESSVRTDGVCLHKEV